MQTFLIFVFFFLSFLLLYVFFGYPIFLLILSLFKKPVPEPPLPEPSPFVSVLVPAHNEAGCIKESIKNKLNIDYPKDKFELIIVSDASTDGMDNIVTNFPDKRVKLVRLPQRGGPGKAIEAGIKAAKAKFIVTSDANSKIDREMVKFLIRHFQDEKIGGVSGNKLVQQFHTSKNEQGESLYLKYENAIKNYEYKVFGTTLSSDSANFAFRKNIFIDNYPTIIGHDLLLSLYMADKGYKIAYDKNAKIYEEYNLSLKSDFFRKSRVVLGGLQAIFLFPQLLCPIKNIRIALQLITHKILRWFACIFLLFLLIINVSLAYHPFFQFVLLCQLLFYLTATIGWVFPNAVKIKVIKLVTYFVSMNMASLVGIYKYWMKDMKRQSAWDKLRT